MSKEEEIETVTLWCAGIAETCMGEGVKSFARRVPPCWNTPGSGGTDAHTGR